MLKSLWKTDYRGTIKTMILQDLSALFAHTQVLERPPPFLHDLIHLDDNHINIKLQELAIMVWIKSNASEPATFQLLNLIETFNDRNFNIENFVRTIIKNMRMGMDIEMLKAFSFMVCTKHSQFLEAVLKQFVSFSDKSILKDFVRSFGKKAVLLLATMMRPGEVKKLLE